MSDKDDYVIQQEDIDAMITHISSDNVTAIEFIKQFNDDDRIDIAISVAANLITYALEKSGFSFPEAVEAMDAFSLSMLDSYKNVLEELGNATVH